jgi:phosphoglycerate kinase
MLDTAREVMARAQELGVEILLPTDVVVADSIDEPSRVEVVAADQIPDDLMVVDLGPTTRQRFAEALSTARSVFWNGPMGVFELEEFAAGTVAIARSLADADAFTVVGGGESVMAIHHAGVADRIDHVSTGGGASLQFLTGETLPAIGALQE